MFVAASLVDIIYVISSYRYGAGIIKNSYF